MNPIKVAFFDTKPYDREFISKHNKDYGFEIKFYETKLKSETVGLARGFDAVCAFVNDTIDKPVADALMNMGIQFIALRSAGYNNVDLKAVYKKIHVARVPAYSPYAVAEHAIALIMSLNRKVHRAYYRIRENNFTLNGLMGFDLYQKTAGVIGTGKIGKAMMNILLGFGMKVLAYDMYPDKKYAEEKGIIYTDLETLYRESDMISLHCPLTPETVNMISSESISKMKPGVMLINTSRGKLIKTKDLIEGLKSGIIGSAGLDVYEEETKYFFEDFSDQFVPDDILARLTTFPNVVITSHQGFFTREALDNIAETTMKNIHEYFVNDQVPNEICYQCGESSPCTKQTKGKCF